MPARPLQPDEVAAEHLDECRPGSLPDAAGTLCPKLLWSWPCDRDVEAAEAEASSSATFEMNSMSFMTADVSLGTY